MKKLIMLFLLISSMMHLQAQQQFRVLSYNVYWGMKQDTSQNKEKFSQWIKAQNADVVALQEMNGFTQAKLQALAESYGHPYAFIVREPFADGSLSFPVAITSKYPIINVRKVVENCIHGFIVAEIEGYNFLITHFHPFSAVKRGYEIDQILATIRSTNKDAPWLLIGDLNSVSPLDKSEYDNNKLRDFIKEDRKKRPQNQNLINEELDYSVQTKILHYGLVDAFKLNHRSFVSSAPTKMFYDQSPHPIRYDYLYVSSNLKNNIVSCEIVKDDFTDIYSDHYPVFLVLKQ